MCKHRIQSRPSPAVAYATNTRTLAYCALLAALSIVFARLILPMPNETTRFSIEAVPIFLAGLFFGPLAGGLVGFSADLIGCLFSGYGYNPIFCLPPILYGVSAGLLRVVLARKYTLVRLALSFLPAVILGSVLYQSAALTLIYAAPSARGAFFLIKLAARSVQFFITWLVDVLLIHTLFQWKLFDRAGLWPPGTGRLARSRKSATDKGAHADECS